MTSITTAQTQRLSLIDVINRCDSFPYPSDTVRLERLSFLTFIVDEIPCGRIHSSVVPHIVAFNQQDRPAFHITDTTIAFMPWLKDYESRSDAIAQMLVSALVYLNVSYLLTIQKKTPHADNQST
jgi:hypothetical protein